MNLYQYYCKDCGYKREGLLDHPAIGIGSYSTICPECGGQYDSYVSDGPAHGFDRVKSTEMDSPAM
jgi:hypothetical protein